MHKDPGHAPARRRHANDAVRCTASYLARRGAHPRQYRGDAASELRGACRRRRYRQGWGGSLGSPPWLPTPPRSWPAGGGGARLASPRRDQGWTVVHPPTGGGRYFIYRPPWVAVSRLIFNRWMRLISKGHPSTNGTLSDWTEAPSARTPSRRPAPLLRRPLRRLRRASISP